MRLVMTVCDWDWQALSGFYQGTAGLIAGLGAVYGAYRLGLRQIGISERQTEIQDRQVALAERTHNAQLFDRRFAVYDEISRGLISMISSEGKEQDAAYLAFISATRIARVVYRDEVNVTIAEITEEVVEFRSSERMLRAEDMNLAEDARQRNYAVRSTLADRLSHMIEMFGYELKLGDAAPISKNL